MYKKKLHIGSLDKSKNQKNFSLNLQVYERLFNISNTACGVAHSLLLLDTIDFIKAIYLSYSCLVRFLLI